MLDVFQPELLESHTAHAHDPQQPLRPSPQASRAYVQVHPQQQNALQDQDLNVYQFPQQQNALEGQAPNIHPLLRQPQAPQQQPSYHEEIQRIVEQNAKLAALLPAFLAQQIVDRWVTAQFRPSPGSGTINEPHVDADAAVQGEISPPGGRRGQLRPPAWTEAELEQARQLRAAGCSFKYVAADLGRSVNSVIARLWRDNGGDPKRAEKQRRGRR